jgi:ribose transport system substrate-binding protein
LYGHIVAALIAAVVETILKEAYKWHILTQESFWIATGMVVVGLLVSFQVWLYWNRRPLVFILMPPFHNNYFYAGLLWSLLDELRRRQLVGVPISHSSGGPAGQNQDFDEILRRKHDYVAGVIAGLEPGVGADDVKRFIAAFGKPVVLVDAEPFEEEKDYPAAAAYAGFDDAAGGVIAAKALLHVLGRDCAAPRILVIGGNLKTQRQLGFQQHIKTLRPQAVVVVDQDGRFLREEASRIAAQYLSDEQKHYDGVFCTNDEMALGALDAMLGLSQKDSKPPLLVGYDAIPEAVREIERGTQFKNTVRQDTSELAARGADLIRTFLKGSRNPPAKINRLKPVVYRKFDLES